MYETLILHTKFIEAKNYSMYAKNVQDVPFIFGPQASVTRVAKQDSLVCQQFSSESIPEWNFFLENYLNSILNDCCKPVQSSSERKHLKG
jgi:hypothetical protein